jgi:CheY-like chemotaxis protein
LTVFSIAESEYLSNFLHCESVSMVKQVILVVEDEPLVKDSIVLELEEAGFEVVAANSGDEASYILPKMRRIDLLITDIRMPGRVNGWALADMARCRRPNLPVLYTSGYTPQHGREVEDSIFLPKPYRVSEILNAIEKLTSGDKNSDAA